MLRFIFSFILTFTIIFPSLGLELQAAQFDEKVLKSEVVWAVEFYSDMCGACQEFEPTWLKVEEKIHNSVSIGRINIDDKRNQVLAEKLGVLEQGIPNIQLFHKKDANHGTAILKDDSMKSKEILHSFREMLKGNVKSETIGKYLKN